MLLKRILWLCPEFVQDRYLSYKDKKQFNKWLASGKPLPPVHAVKQQRIVKIKQKYDIEILVETGTYLGDMVWAQRKNFSQIYSIELSNTFANIAKKRFRKFSNISIIEGDSGFVMPSLIELIKEKAIFWLDGHYSGGKTACSTKECPIYEELEAIFKSEIEHILLIDDARCFVGENSYPTKEDLFAFILQKFPGSHIEIEDDCIIIELKSEVEKTMAFDKISPSLCTSLPVGLLD